MESCDVFGRQTGSFGRQTGSFGGSSDKEGGTEPSHFPIEQPPGAASGADAIFLVAAPSSPVPKQRRQSLSVFGGAMLGRKRRVSIGSCSSSQNGGHPGRLAHASPGTGSGRRHSVGVAGGGREGHMSSSDDAGGGEGGRRSRRTSVDLAGLAMLTGRMESDGERRPSVQVSPEEVGEMKKRLDMLKVEGVRRRSIVQGQMLGRGANAELGRSNVQDVIRPKLATSAPAVQPFSSRNATRTDQDLQIRLATRNALTQKRNKDAVWFIVAMWIEPGVVEGIRFAKEEDAQAKLRELSSGITSARMFDMNYKQLGSYISRLQRQGNVATMDEDFRRYWENDQQAPGMFKPGEQVGSVSLDKPTQARRNSAMAAIKARRNSATIVHSDMKNAVRRNSAVAFGAKITSTGHNAMKDALSKADRAVESLCKTPGTDSDTSGDEMLLSNVEI